MKTKTTTLAITTSSLPATQPRPRKADIIAALVGRAAVKHYEMKKQADQKRETKRAEITEFLKSEMATNPQNFDVRLSSAQYTPELEFTIKVIPAGLKKLQEELCKLPDIRDFDSSRSKREIISALGDDEASRVKALLSNAEAVKKLDETLENLGC